MAIEITMPKLSDTMQEGTILKWRVQQGARVSQGDIIAEVETDKAAMEMEAFESGVVRELRVPEGETVEVGTVIAVLGNGEAKEEVPSREAAPARPMPEEKAKEIAGEAAAAEEEKGRAAVEKARAAREEEEERQRRRKKEAREREEAAPREKEAAEPPIPEPAEADRIAAREEPKRVAGLRREEMAASPAARRLARERRVDLSRVRGTGPGGRIVLADVERAEPARAEAPPRPAAPEKGKREGERPERSLKIRRIVGRKMVESWQNVPHFFVTVAVDMTDVIRIRKDLGASINDFMVAAAARCLGDYPWVNSYWVEGEPVEQKEINIAIAVATDRGLFNPVIRDCRRLSLKEIGRRAADLVERAHAGRLKNEELEGGTFTISNMGMLGVESFSAIITPPQAAVLAVGTVRGEVVVDERGEPAVATMVRLTLSADHRILDGADAAEFLTAMKSYLEAPVTLITSNYGKEP